MFEIINKHQNTLLALFSYLVLVVFTACSAETPTGPKTSHELPATENDEPVESDAEFAEAATTLPVANVASELDSAGQSTSDSLPHGEFTTETVTEEHSPGIIRSQYDVRSYEREQIRHGSYREFYPDGALFCEGEYFNRQRDGTWVFYHPDGVVAREAEFERGLPVGTWRLYRPNGLCERMTTYENGQRHGKQTTFWDDGETMKMEEHYEGNRRHGIVKRYDEAGNKIHEMCFRDGLPNGPELRWYSDGQLAAEGNYVEGRPHGLFVYYDAEGTKTAEVKWTDGRRAPSGVISKQVTEE